MTPDEIMALALDMENGSISEVQAKEAAVRAAVERIVRERDDAKTFWRLRSERAERERDEARALLVRIRDATHTNAVTLRGMADEGLARIDAKEKAE